jgi:hypothetical protein
MSKYIQFTKQDSVHAALGTIPASFLVWTGHISAGVAFAIGLLPTSLLGFAPTRKLRLIYGFAGCLFGVGILTGSLVINSLSLPLAGLLFLAISFIATVLAAKRPAGGLLVSLLLPSLAIGTGYAVTNAFGLSLAFIAGALWACLVMLPWPEFAPDKQVQAKLQALQPKYVKTYGVLIGMTMATSILIGHAFNIPYYGWIATAAMLVIRPMQQMTGWRGIGRAISTIAGTLLVVISIGLGLGYFATAVGISLIAIVTIGARTSKLYVSAFGTAFLILTIELYGLTNTADIYSAGVYRIFNNVLGVLIALFYGLLISWLLECIYQMRPNRPGR